MLQPRADQIGESRATPLKLDGTPVNVEIRMVFEPGGVEKATAPGADDVVDGEAVS
jgi:hypothetical protein